MADPQRFARAVVVFARALGRIGRERAREADITPQQAEALQLIAEQGGVSTSTLAIRLGIDPSTASRNLAGLERAGLVVRRRHADDGRQSDVRLTPRGNKLATKLASQTLKAFATLIERVPRAERQRVTDALVVLAETTAER